MMREMRAQFDETDAHRVKLQSKVYVQSPNMSSTLIGHFDTTSFTDKETVLLTRYGFDYNRH
jgi:hypothetical protein